MVGNTNQMNMVPDTFAVFMSFLFFFFPQCNVFVNSFYQCLSNTDQCYKFMMHREPEITEAYHSILFII